MGKEPKTTMTEHEQFKKFKDVHEACHVQIQGPSFPGDDIHLTFLDGTLEGESINVYPGWMKGK